MTLRGAHGQARKVGGLVVEVPPPDELPYADPPVARDARGHPLTPDDARRLAKSRGLAFVRRTIAVHPDFAVHYQHKLEWLKQRQVELMATTGEVSAGVGAMINAASWLYAGAEFAAERAAKDGNADAFKLSAQLSQTARQHELAAWELAVRESKARPRPDGDEVEQEYRRLMRERASK